MDRSSWVLYGSNVKMSAVRSTVNVPPETGEPAAVLAPAVLAPARLATAWELGAALPELVALLLPLPPDEHAASAPTAATRAADIRNMVRERRTGSLVNGTSRTDTGCTGMNRSGSPLWKERRDRCTGGDGDPGSGCGQSAFEDALGLECLTNGGERARCRGRAVNSQFGE